MAEMMWHRRETRRLREVLAFIGSPQKERSNTYALTKMVLDRLSELDRGIECEILTAGHVRIGFCHGCELCMSKGFRPEDEHDDVAMIKSKMIRADMIFIGSPIYGGGITGQMKAILHSIPESCAAVVKHPRDNGLWDAGSYAEFMERNRRLSDSLPCPSE